MEVHRTLYYVSQQTWTTKDIWFAPCPRRCLLRLEERLRLATVALRVSALENRLYYWFRKWRIEGTFERLNAALRERLRVLSGRNAQPSAGVVDSQSAKTTGVGGEQRGYDGGKKVRGILSDSCWWTRKAWFSRSRSTAQRSPTKTA